MHTYTIYNDQCYTFIYINLSKSVYLIKAYHLDFEKNDTVDEEYSIFQLK